MLFKHPGSRVRYTDYIRRRKDPRWAKLDKAAAQAAELERRKGGRPAKGEGPERPARSRAFWRLFAEFWGQLRGSRGLVIAALATLSLSAGIGLLMPASTKIAIDYIITDSPGPVGLPARVLGPLGIEPPYEGSDKVRLLWALGGAMVAVAFVNILVGTWGRWQMTSLTKRTQASMRRQAYEHAVSLPLHKIYTLKSGGVVGILREDAGQAADLLFSMIYNPWRAVIQLFGTLVILAVVDWRMLVGGLALIPLTWVTHRTWINRIRPVYRDIKITRTGIDSHTTEAFGGMRVVRGFGRQHGEAARFANANHYMARQEMLVWWESRVLEIVWGVLIPLASAAVLLYGGSQVINGSLSIGDVMMFSTYLLMLLGPMETLTSTAATIQGNLAAFDRVLDMLGEPKEFADSTGARQVARGVSAGRVTIRDVSFMYPVSAKAKERVEKSGAAQNGELTSAEIKHGPVLHDINLDVKPGETIALVGPSGSGKTTLCNLVARFYNPTSGAILLDGVDLREIDISSYRRLLGIVEQDVFLFDGSVAENIAYARRDASIEQIRRAAADADADEFIEKLEHGYDTVIGERGVRLSGGQKQRIAIARALLADPLILILDEATSNLDSESEALIQRSLARLMQGRTSFVIAHRLSTVRHADRIVVLEEGRIVEVGSHQELNARSGRYAELLRLQVEGVGAGPARASA